MKRPIIEYSNFSRRKYETDSGARVMMRWYIKYATNSGLCPYGDDKAINEKSMAWSINKRDGE
jgi:hypothetical protein